MSKIMEAELHPTPQQHEKLLKCCEWSTQVYNNALDAVSKEKNIADKYWDIEALTKVLTKTRGAGWDQGIPVGIIQGSLKYLSDVLTENLGHPYWNINNARLHTVGSVKSFTVTATQGVKVTSEDVVIPTVGAIEYDSPYHAKLTGLEYILVVYDGEHPEDESAWFASVVAK